MWEQSIAETINQKEYPATKVACFERVSFEEFKNAFKSCGYGNELEARDAYTAIKIPVRKTRKSAGHDISIPFSLRLSPGEKTLIPTGLRCGIREDYVMLIFPRSSLGIKRGMKISNTIPVIDADYFEADNEGHIFISIENLSKKDIILEKGDSFVQALFFSYGIAVGSGSSTRRKGGIGSTDEP